MENMKNSSDEQLVEYVRTKNKNAYRELVTRYENRLIRYALRITHNPDYAKDAVQQAFIKAYVNLNSFNTNKKFSSWIYRIVHNEALNLLKKEKRNVHLEQEHLEEMTAGSEEIIQELIGGEDAEELMKNLETLELKYRTPLLLYYFEEKSYDEISEILKIPIGTVGTNINRGKQKLKQHYER